MDLIKYDMTDIWAVAGDVVAPDSSKIRAGWGVEVVPRQWWNWFENRQDNNLAYMLQKGIPEWDATTEYIINKSHVQRNGIVYRAAATSTNSDPVALTSWVKAFADSTPYLEAIKSLAVSNNTMPFINGSGAAQNTATTAFGRSVLNVADDAAARTLINAQLAHVNLTGLSSVSGAANNLPYFTGAGAMAVTTFTGFARTLLDDADAAAMRATLGVYSVADSDAALAAGLATKQPLNTNLTNYAALTIPVSTMVYNNSSNVLSTTPVGLYGRGFLNLADAAASRTYIGADDASNLTTGTIPLARIPTNLTGVNSATATKLQTARTIQGVSFDGTANITLSVVDKDSSTGSAVMPAGTSAQRTASPANGMLRYNNETNEFEGYQNGAWAGIGGGTPLYTVLWWPNRASIPAGYIPADGQLLSRTTYQAAFAGVNSGILPVVSDATWLATSTSRGCYTPGDGSTNFRIPDLNGKASGTFAAPFLRGDGTNSAGTPGTFQADAFQGHFHNASFNTFISSTAFTSGAQSVVLQGSGSPSTIHANTVVTDGSNGTPRIASETRPTNVTGVYVIKLIGGASELSQDDASLAVAALETKLAYVSGRNRIINGDCRVQQRSNVSVTAGTSVYGGPDRYIAINANATGGVFNQAAGTMVIDGVSTPCVVHNVTTPPTNLTSTNYFGGIAQVVEGFNCFDMVGKPVTLSFQFIATATGTYSVALRDGAGTRSFVSTFSATAGVITKVSVSIPAIPFTATVPNTNSGGLIVNIGTLNTGTYVAPTLNGWNSGNYFAASTNTNWATTTSSYIAATNIQLELGTVATPFEKLNVVDQIVQCQRYFQYAYTGIRFYSAGAGVTHTVPIPFPVLMRASPTMTFPSAAASANVASSNYGPYSAGGGGYNVIASAVGDCYVIGATFSCSAEL